MSVFDRNTPSPYLTERDAHFVHIYAHALYIEVEKASVWFAEIGLITP